MTQNAKSERLLVVANELIGADSPAEVFFISLDESGRVDESWAMAPEDLFVTRHDGLPRRLVLAAPDAAAGTGDGVLAIGVPQLPASVPSASQRYSLPHGTGAVNCYAVLPSTQGVRLEYSHRQGLSRYVSEFGRCLAVGDVSGEGRDIEFLAGFLLDDAPCVLRHIQGGPSRLADWKFEVDFPAGLATGPGFASSLAFISFGAETFQLALGSTAEASDDSSPVGLWVLDVNRVTLGVEAHRFLSAPELGVVTSLRGRDLFGSSLARLRDGRSSGLDELCVGAPGLNHGEGGVWLIARERL